MSGGEKKDTDCCIICNKEGGDVQVSSKGLASISTASLKREDGKVLPSEVDDTRVHEACRRDYISPKRIQSAIKNKENSIHGPQQRVLRTLQGSFDYKTHCLICSNCIDADEIGKHPSRSSVSSVEIVKKSDKCSTLQTTLMNICSNRHDEKALNVNSRIVCAGDIRAVEAQYHRKCMQVFLLESKSNNSNTRNFDRENADAFKELCAWLLSQSGRQFTIHDLLDRHSHYLPEGCEPYSGKHMKRLLLEQFGQCITVTKISGRPNVYTFTDTAASILHDSYRDEDKENLDEEIRQAKSSGKTLRKCLLDLRSSSEQYPSPEDIEINRLEEEIPPALRAFVQSLLGHSISSSPKHRLKEISLCHIMMQACAHPQYQSPLLLSTGLFVHQSTRSKVLINVLAGLGVTVSYDQVLEFERSAVVSKSVNDLHPGLSTLDSGGGFCQWMADNFDYNEDTTSGQNSTHVMGIIACQTPPTIDKIIVQKQKQSPADILSAGDFSMMLNYDNPATNHMSKIKYKLRTQVNVPKLSEYVGQDMLWLLSNARRQVTPGWQGFMSDMIQGDYLRSSIVYHPMIPLNPQTNEAVHSTMVFVDKQRQKIGQCCALLTFDQPLYAKAFKIKTESPDEFSHVQLRLGGFHQLMSFLGAGCKVMQCSGLEEVWACVYARNSIPKMYDGKSYYKTLRACLLTSAALHMLLFEPLQEDNGLDIAESDSDGLGDGSNSVDSQDSPPMTDKACLLRDVEMICKDLVAHHQQFSDSDTMELITFVQEEKKKFQNSRTASLWLQFMEFVSIVCMFVRAERTGDWLLHMKASQDMLPWFAATGHNNYARYCRLYIQDFADPCDCLKQPLQDGLFTVRRNCNLFWSGTWSDMVIEQSLMRTGKTHGGLINITHKESARTRWLLSGHIVAQYTEALRSLTNASPLHWTDHHRDLNPGRVQQDYDDMMKFLQYLRNHNPFHGVESDLRNIGTGVIADGRVNVDKAVSIGEQIQESINDRSFGDVSFKRNQQVVTFEVMKKALVLKDEKIHMSFTELYQRLLSLAYTTGSPPASVFSYELATVSPSLFHDDGSLRKGQKSQLMNSIINMNDKIVTDGPYPIGGVVYDGCALLQKLQWPKVGTLKSVCEIFTSAVSNKLTTNRKVVVVFDSYDVTITKDQEQKRRKRMKIAVPDMIIDLSSPVPTDVGSFLANKRNKQQTIHLLSSHLEKAKIDVEHAGEEGDADTAIVKKTLEMAKETSPVRVVSDDTDVFVLLLHHADAGNNIVMQTRTRTLSVREAQSSIGPQLCQLLPFLHAMSGCDTTSTLYGFGKAKHLKYLTDSPQLQEKTKLFGDVSVPLQVIGEIGEEYIAGLYKGGKAEKSVNELRFRNMTSTRYVSIERMPPTSRSCYYHSLRVHLQVSTWQNLKTVLDREKHGFQTLDGNVNPIITDKAPAPPELLKEVRCSCRRATQLCVSCSCVKKGLPCSIHCKCESACDNGVSRK